VVGVQVLLAAAALLLLATGLAKIARPTPTGLALAALLPALPIRRAPFAARALGLVEIVAAAVALAVAGPAGPVAVALCYLGFAGYVAHSLRAPGVPASCGCSGRDDTPVTGAHLALNIAFGLAAAVAAAAGTSPLLRGAPAPAALVAASALAVVAACAGWLVVTVHPQLVAARRLLRSPVREP
jgi:hypothetical protein